MTQKQIGNIATAFGILCVTFLFQNCKRQNTTKPGINKTVINSVPKSLSKEEVAVNTADLVYDADGNSYTTIRIGDQVWMADNLRTTKCWDGTPLTKIDIGSTSKTGALYFIDNNEKSIAAREYGPMYNWAAVENCDICPKNFKIPSRIEWRKLIRFWYGKNGVPAGALGLQYASYKLREPGNRLWSKRYAYADTIPAIGFCAKPGGWLEDGELQFYRERTGWWGRNKKLPVINKMADGDGGTWIADATQEYSAYVRCVKFK